MVASQLPELPAYSESRGASDLPYGRGVATSRKVVLLKSRAPLVPSSAWEVVTGPSSSCPRASAPVSRLQQSLECVPSGSGSDLTDMVAMIPHDTPANQSADDEAKQREFDGGAVPVQDNLVNGEAGLSPIGTCGPRAPGPHGNSLKCNPSEGTELPRFFFRCFWA